MLRKSHGEQALPRIARFCQSTLGHRAGKKSLRERKANGVFVDVVGKSIADHGRNFVVNLKGNREDHGPCS